MGRQGHKHAALSDASQTLRNYGILGPGKKPALGKFFGLGDVSPPLQEGQHAETGDDRLGGGNVAKHGRKKSKASTQFSSEPLSLILMTLAITFGRPL